MPEKVCAVVVTHNRLTLLRECLSALEAQTRRPDRVLVIDNASTDGTLEAIRAEFPAAELVSLPDNRGSSGGFYAGLEAAGARRGRRPVAGLRHRRPVRSPVSAAYRENFIEFVNPLQFARGPLEIWRRRGDHGAASTDLNRRRRRFWSEHERFYPSHTASLDL